jgi:ferredoxin
VDGTYPSGTTAYEKRNISELVAVWDDDTCIQCGNCSFVCPHTVIRSKYYDPASLDGAPDGFQSAPLVAPGLPDSRFSLQVYAEDCTGCGLCVDACPVVVPGDPVTKAINLGQREPLVAAARESVAFFETLPMNNRSRVDFGTVRGTQFLEPLFEFPVRVRRVRRDPVHQAALAAVRRPADGGQRDRVLLHLRREPADDAVDDRRQRPGAGMVELALRGRRRVRPRLPARRRRAPPRWRTGGWPSCATRWAPSWWTASWMAHSSGSLS